MIAIGIVRQRRRQRQVVGDVRVDRVADELGVADQRRRDEVAQGQREGEDRAGDDRREDERPDDAAERLPGLRTEVVGGGHERVRDPLEPRVDGDDHVRQPDVAHDEPDGDVAVAGAVQAEGLERPVEDALLAEDRAPGVDLDQIRGPQRHQHGDHEQALRPGPGDLRHEERQRQRQQRVGHGHRGGDQHRPQRDRPVDRVAEDRLEVVQRERLLDLAAQLAERPEAGGEQAPPASRGSRRPASPPGRPAAPRPGGADGRGRGRRASGPPTSSASELRAPLLPRSSAFSGRSPT